MPLFAGMRYNGSPAPPGWTNERFCFFGRNQTNRCGPHLDPEDPQPLFRFSRLSTKCFWYSDPPAIHAIARIANHLWRFWVLSVVAVALSKRRNAVSFVRWNRVLTLSTDRYSADKEFSWSVDDEQEMDAICCNLPFQFMFHEVSADKLMTALHWDSFVLAWD